MSSNFYICDARTNQLYEPRGDEILGLLRGQGDADPLQWCCAGAVCCMVSAFFPWKLGLFAAGSGVVVMGYGAAAAHARSAELTSIVEDYVRARQFAEMDPIFEPMHGRACIMIFRPDELERQFE